MSLKKFLLTWDAAGGEPTGYKAEYKKTADSSWTEYPQVFPTTSGFVTGLDVCSFYNFRVFGVNIKGNGLASSPATGIMGRVPGSPMGLVAISEFDISSETVSIQLSWSTDNGGCGVQKTFIEHKISGALSNYITNTLPDNTTNYSITGLVGSTTYDIRLRASNVVGTGIYSNEFFHTTVNEPTIPAQTTNLNVEYVENSPAILTINALINNYIYVETDTGYYKIVGAGWTDTGAESSYYYFTNDIATDTEIKIYACDSAGNIGGDILNLETNGIRLKNIDVSKLKMLNTLNLTDTASYDPLQSISIDLSHLLELTSLTLALSFYEITSLRAAGVSLQGNNNISANTTDVSTINRFYHDLNTTTGANLYLSITNDNSTENNTRNDSIAATKGYTVY